MSNNDALLIVMKTHIGREVVGGGGCSGGGGGGSSRGAVNQVVLLVAIRVVYAWL